MKSVKGDYIKIETFTGETIEGFKVNHPRELPKSATHDRYTYSVDFKKTYSIYHAFTKSGTKYYIWETNS